MSETIIKMTLAIKIAELLIIPELRNKIKEKS